MEVLLKNTSESEIEILFELSWEEFLPYCEKACLKISNDLKVPGFRQGKIPMEIVIREVGDEKVFLNAAELAINKEYEKFVSEKKLEKEIEVMGLPKIEILKLASKNPFSFKIKTAIFPKFDLPDYKKIALQFPKKEISATPEEIEEALARIKKSRTEFEELETPIKEGDFLEIEYNSPQIKEDTCFKDGFFLGQGGFIAGFEENLIGMKKNEEKEFNLQDKGKQIFFKVKVHKIQKANIPELNDDFAKEFGCVNLVAFKQVIEREIKKEKEKFEIQKIQTEILKKIIEQTKIHISELLLEAKKEQMMRELKQRVENNLKISFEKYLEEIKKSKDDLKKTLINEAKKRIQTSLILKKIGEQESITVERAEIEPLVNEFLKNFLTDEKKKNIDIDALREYYRNIIYTEKVLQKILD